MELLWHSSLDSLPCWHVYDMTWRGHEMSVGTIHSGMSTWHFCHLSLSMQFCFPYIESESVEKVSGHNSLICIPVKRKAWTHQSSALAVTSGALTAQILGWAGWREMEVMRQGEGSAACSSASIFHLWCAFLRPAQTLLCLWMTSDCS